MKPADPAPTDGGDAGATFTVVFPAVLRDRFERWLRREHLWMVTISRDDPHRFAVAPPRLGRPTTDRSERKP